MNFTFYTTLFQNYLNLDDSMSLQIPVWHSEYTIIMILIALWGDIMEGYIPTCNNN